MLHFTSHQYPQMRMLSDDQIRDLHLAALEILERTGVAVQHERALELLTRAGARVDGERVRIPGHLVDRAIRSAPERVVLSTRTGDRAMPLEDGRVFFGTGSDTPNTIDPETGQRRRSRRQDVANFARLCDALPNIDFIMSMGVASDAPDTALFIHEFADMVMGSSKPMVFTASDENDIAQIHRIAAAVAGGEDALRARPFLIHYSEPVTPLIHTPAGLAKLLFCADHGIPVAYVSGIGAGGSAPAALAGACALANAECLSGLVIHQLASPGAPFIYGANVSVLDMHTLVMTYGGPDLSLTNAAFAEMARFYRLPVWGLAGATDSKVVDAQAGIEATCSISAAILSRGNLVHDVGYIESGLTSSMEMLAMCDEIIAMLRILYTGLPMDKERLAVDVIDEVGPGGHFLVTEHTRRFFRTDHFLPRLIDRSNFQRWTQAGSTDLAGRANTRLREILASHQPAPVPDEAQAVIDEVLSA